ncbi:MAG: hypothetical protein CM15mP32_0500 [Flavobacteriaceae bacterium]|nr:MAG: hypothetical protein CM15mP32_0500 [Flavobacteriaceae bacterium]
MMLTAQLLRDFPVLNSSLSGNKIIQKGKSTWVWQLRSPMEILLFQL